MIVQHEITLQRVKQVERVTVEGLDNLKTCAQDVMAKAMQLTDAWGQAMFIMDKPLVERLFSTLGFSGAVCAGVYEGVRSLAYVQHKRVDADTQTEFTWHAMDAAVMTLRGIVGLGTAMAGINDTNVEAFIEGNKDLFEKLMGVMPDYTANLMFSPEVAATVVATLGGNISADKIYEMAWKHGRQVTKDLDGRRGVSTQFVRSLTLTISARI